MEKLGKIIHPKDAKVFMDEQELVREYLHTDKITFGVSRLKVLDGAGIVGQHGGTTGDLANKGHVAQIVLLAVIQNRVKEDCAHQAIKAALHGHLGAGEALLLGDEDALISWSCAPHP